MRLAQIHQSPGQPPSNGRGFSECLCKGVRDMYRHGAWSAALHARCNIDCISEETQARAPPADNARESATRMATDAHAQAMALTALCRQAPLHVLHSRQHINCKRTHSQCVIWGAIMACSGHVGITNCLHLENVVPVAKQQGRQQQRLWCN